MWFIAILADKLSFFTPSVETAMETDTLAGTDRHVETALDDNSQSSCSEKEHRTYQKQLVEIRVTPCVKSSMLKQQSSQESEVSHQSDLGSEATVSCNDSKSSKPVHSSGTYKLRDKSRRVLRSTASKSLSFFSSSSSSSEGEDMEKDSSTTKVRRSPRNKTSLLTKRRRKVNGITGKATSVYKRLGSSQSESSQGTEATCSASDDANSKTKCLRSKSRATVALSSKLTRSVRKNSDSLRKRDSSLSSTESDSEDSMDSSHEYLPSQKVKYSPPDHNGRRLKSHSKKGTKGIRRLNLSQKGLADFLSASESSHSDGEDVMDMAAPPQHADERTQGETGKDNHLEDNKSHTSYQTNAQIQSLPDCHKSGVANIHSYPENKLKISLTDINKRGSRTESNTCQSDPEYSSSGKTQIKGRQRNLKYSPPDRNDRRLRSHSEREQSAIPRLNLRPGFPSASESSQSDSENVMDTAASTQHADVRRSPRGQRNVHGTHGATDMKSNDNHSESQMRHQTNTPIKTVQDYQKSGNNLKISLTDINKHRSRTESNTYQSDSEHSCSGRRQVEGRQRGLKYTPPDHKDRRLRSHSEKEQSKTKAIPRLNLRPGFLSASESSQSDGEDVVDTAASTQHPDVKRSPCGPRNEHSTLGATDAKSKDNHSESQLKHQTNTPIKTVQDYHKSGAPNVRGYPENNLKISLTDINKCGSRTESNTRQSHPGPGSLGKRQINSPTKRQRALPRKAKNHKAASYTQGPMGSSYLYVGEVGVLRDVFGLRRSPRVNLSSTVHKLNTQQAATQLQSGTRNVASKSSNTFDTGGSVVKPLQKRHHHVSPGNSHPLLIRRSERLVRLKESTSCDDVQLQSAPSDSVNKLTVMDTDTAIDHTSAGTTLTDIQPSLSQLCKSPAKSHTQVLSPVTDNDTLSTSLSQSFRRPKKRLKFSQTDSECDSDNHTGCKNAVKRVRFSTSEAEQKLTQLAGKGCHRLLGRQETDASTEVPARTRVKPTSTASCLQLAREITVTTDTSDSQSSSSSSVAVTEGIKTRPPGKKKETKRVSLTPRTQLSQSNDLEVMLPSPELLSGSPAVSVTEEPTSCPTNEQKGTASGIHTVLNQVSKGHRSHRRDKQKLHCSKQGTGRSEKSQQHHRHVTATKLPRNEKPKSIKSRALKGNSSSTKRGSGLKPHHPIPSKKFYKAGPTGSKGRVKQRKESRTLSASGVHSSNTGSSGIHKPTAHTTGSKRRTEQKKESRTPPARGMRSSNTGSSGRDNPTDLGAPYTGSKERVNQQKRSTVTTAGDEWPSSISSHKPTSSHFTPHPGSFSSTRATAFPATDSSGIQAEGGVSPEIDVVSFTPEYSEPTNTTDTISGEPAHSSTTYFTHGNIPYQSQLVQSPTVHEIYSPLHHHAVDGTYMYPCTSVPTPLHESSQHYLSPEIGLTNRLVHIHSGSSSLPRQLQLSSLATGDRSQQQQLSQAEQYYFVDSEYEQSQAQSQFYHAPVQIVARQIHNSDSESVVSASTVSDIATPVPKQKALFIPSFDAKKY